MRRRPRGERFRDKWQKIRFKPLNYKIAAIPDQRLLADDSRKTIERFVRQNANENTFSKKLQSLSDKIGSFETIERNIETVSQLWCNRSAVEIIFQKNLIAIDSLQRARFRVEGCSDVAIAFIASVRILAKLEGKKARAYFVRWGTHAGVRVITEGEDLLFLGGKAKHLKGRVLEKLNSDKRNGIYAEGSGPREIGLNSLADFHKYAPKQQDR